MEGVGTFWTTSDGVGRLVALLLLAMSVSSWVTILWKLWVLKRARRDIERGVPAFWAAPTLAEGRDRMAAFDREQVLAPLIDAAGAIPVAGTLASGVHLDSQLTRRLRDALHRGLAHLQFGQVLLASIGSTSPFIGLFGTVWGIYHALLAIASSGQVMIDKVAGPVGEALVMTAAGLAVAIPAVLAYNAFVRGNRIVLAELDGFAHDVLALVITGRRLRDHEGDALHSAVAPLAASRVVR